MGDGSDSAEKPTRPVVKKTVVKKTVVRKSTPSVRIGRPSPTATTTKTKGEPTRQRQKVSPKSKPKVAKSGGPKTKSAGRTGTTATGALFGSVKKAGAGIGSAADSTYRGVRSWRLPRFEPTMGSALVGVLIGLVAVALTVAFAAMFGALRGTSTGGGRWGSLTVVVVAFVAFALGEYLLAKLHVRQPRITSFIGIGLAFIAILAFLLGLIATAWAWLILPALSGITYAIAHRLVSLTEAPSKMP